jgi:hypothetical protein
VTGRPTGDDAVSLDTSVPHIARVYDYWLGGKDNFAADAVSSGCLGMAAVLVGRAFRGFPVFSYRGGRCGLLLPEGFSRCCPQPGYRAGRDQG